MSLMPDEPWPPSPRHLRGDMDDVATDQWSNDGDPAWSDRWGSEPPAAMPPARGSASTIEPTEEPVVISQAVTIVVGALVGLGWVELDQTAVKLVGTAIAAVIVATVTLVTRSRVWTAAAVRRELGRRNTR